MKLLIVAGARPNFMKVAPLVRAARARDVETVLVHTGQHYDAEMSDAFFTDLGLSAPDYCLGVGSGSHAQQTARVMEGFEPLVMQERADWVVVVGDVNSTLGCALATAKVAAEVGSRIAHVEAGLRSGDWSMPEEINRVLTDRLSDALLTPSADAGLNLAREGIPGDRVRLVGNVMIDSLVQALPKATAADVAGSLGLADRGYVVATLHRPASVDDPGILATALAALSAISAEYPVVLPMHPRTRKAVAKHGLESSLGGVVTVPPLGYVQMLSLVSTAAAVVTDSGGVQEETTFLGIPCVTLRNVTERPITVTHGTNRLAPWPPDAATVLATFRSVMREFSDRARPSIPFWDGCAAPRVIEALEQLA